MSNICPSTPAIPNHFLHIFNRSETHYDDFTANTALHSLEKPTARSPTGHEYNITTVTTQLAATSHGRSPLPIAALLTPQMQASIQDTEVAAPLRDPRHNILLDQGLAARHHKQVFQGPQEAGQLTYSLMATQTQQHNPAQLAPFFVAPPGPGPRLAKAAIRATTECSFKEDSGLDAKRKRRQAGKADGLMSEWSVVATRVIAKTQTKLGLNGVSSARRRAPQLSGTLCS